MSRVITTILFDLDHTLYEPATGLLHAGDRLITRYLAHRLKLLPEAADALRVRLWRQYGTSARGAEIEFGLAQPEFYYESLKALDPAEHLEPDAPLAAMLGGLPAELHVVTNSAADYAHRVLRALGIDHCFHEVFGIEALQWRPKPEASAYQCVLQRLGRDPTEIAMVEDFPWNLVPAKQLGMFTVFLGPEPQEADVWLQRLLDLPAKLDEAEVELRRPD